MFIGRPFHAIQTAIKPLSAFLSDALNAVHLKPGVVFLALRTSGLPEADRSLKACCERMLLLAGVTVNKSRYPRTKRRFTMQTVHLVFYGHVYLCISDNFKPRNPY